MGCIIRKHYKKQLSEYTDILGSEDAAFYVLTQNNGCMLDKAPNGEPSQLFESILQACGGDYRQATTIKASLYYPSFTNSFGDWLMQDPTILPKESKVDENFEPTIEQALPYLRVPEFDVNDVLTDSNSSLNPSDRWHGTTIIADITDDDRNTYVLNNTTEENYTISGQQQLSEDWAKDRQKKLADSFNQSMLDAFGLVRKTDDKGNIYFESESQDEGSNLRVMFCQYIEDSKGEVHDGMYDQTGRMYAASNVIWIGLNEGDPQTLNHELIHHYLRMFWNTTGVQEFLSNYDEGDRTEGWERRLEEKAVGAILRRSKTISTRSNTVIGKLWQSLSNVFKMLFEGISQYHKSKLLDKVTLGFVLNEKVGDIAVNERLLSYAYPKTKLMFNTNEDIDVFNNMFNDIQNSNQEDKLKLYLMRCSSHYSRYMEEAIQNNDHSRQTDLQNALITASSKAAYFLKSEIDQAIADIRDGIDENLFTSAYQSNALLALIDQIQAVQPRREQRRGTVNEEHISNTDESSNTSTYDKKFIDRVIKLMDKRISWLRHHNGSEDDIIRVMQQKTAFELINDPENQLKYLLNDIIGPEFSQVIQLLQAMALQKDSKGRGYANMSFEQLQALKQNTIEYYTVLFDYINKLFASRVLDEANQSQMIMSDELRSLLQPGQELEGYGGLISLLEFKIKDFSHMLQNIEHILITRDMEQERKEQVGDILTDDEFESYMKTYKDWLFDGVLFNDINSFQPWVGMGSRSRNPIIRMFTKSISDTENEIRRTVLGTAVYKLMDAFLDAKSALNSINPHHQQAIFQEVDENGVPTGYMVSNVNRGKFYRARNKYAKQLRDEFNPLLERYNIQITENEKGNSVLPISDDENVKEILNKYEDKMDDWLSQNAERRFKPEYYKKRRQILSRETRDYLDDIQKQINIILSKCPIVDGVKATYLLSTQEQIKLARLIRDRRNSGNAYFEDGIKKDGPYVKIAKEVTAWRKWLQEHSKSKPNQEAFDAAIADIRRRFGDNSEVENTFRKLNTKTTINSDFYDLVTDLCQFTNNPELDALRARKNDLIKLIDDNGVRKDLIQTKSSTYWEELKQIENAIQEIYESEPEEQPEYTWSMFFDKKQVMYDSETSMYDHMVQLEKDRLMRGQNYDLTDQNVINTIQQQAEAKYSINVTTRNGVIRKPLSSFYQYVPKNLNSVEEGYCGIFVEGNKAETIENALRQRGMDYHKVVESNGDILFRIKVAETNPSGMYSEMDEDATDFLNTEKFDKNSTDNVQPIKSIYNSDRQMSIINGNPKIRALYDAMLEVDSLANDWIPNYNKGSFLLPQIMGRDMTIISRHSGNLKSIFDSIGYVVKQEFTEVSESRDQELNLNKATSFDGDRIKTIPIRYVHQLDDMSTITSDVVGSIIAKFEMACNFHFKTELAYRLESYKDVIDERANPGPRTQEGAQSTANTSSQLDTIMDQKLYGNNITMGNDSLKMSKTQKKWIKILEKFRNICHVLMLGYNTTSAAAGFAESSTRNSIEALLGKNYTMRDYRKALAYISKHTMGFNSNLRDVGSIKLHDKAVGLMQWFGISKSLMESYKNTEKSQAWKILMDNASGMGPFSYGDYVNNMFSLIMALSNQRFFEENNKLGVPAGFYTKRTLFVALRKNGMSFKDAKNNSEKAYSDAPVSMFDAYELKDGKIQVIDKYKDYITTKLENRITGKVDQTSANSNGTTPMSDPSKLNQNMFGRFIAFLKHWMFTALSQRLNYGHDFNDYQRDENGEIVRDENGKPVKMEGEQYFDGYINEQVGDVSIGIFQGLVQYLRHIKRHMAILRRQAELTQQDEMEQYATHRVIMEMSAIVLFAGIACAFASLKGGEDDDDWVANYGELLGIRLVNSLEGQLDILTAMDMIKNPTAVLSPLQDMITFILQVSELLPFLSTHSLTDQINTGAYKGDSRWFRNLCKILPIGNLYEDCSIGALKAKQTWYMNQTPTLFTILQSPFKDIFAPLKIDNRSTKKKIEDAVE